MKKDGDVCESNTTCKRSLWRNMDFVLSEHRTGWYIKKKKIKKNGGNISTMSQRIDGLSKNWNLILRFWDASKYAWMTSSHSFILYSCKHKSQGSMIGGPYHMFEIKRMRWRFVAKHYLFIVKLFCDVSQ